MATTRTCINCKQTKPLISFPGRKGTDYRGPTCCVCKKHRNRKAHPNRYAERRKAEGLRRRAKAAGLSVDAYLAQREALATQTAKHLLNRTWFKHDGRVFIVKHNKRKRCPLLAAYPKIDYLVNRDYYRAKERERYRNDPAKALAKKQRRRARKANVDHPLTLTEWAAIKKRFRFRCAYCGLKRKMLSQDHVIPLHLGGPHSVDNVVPACISCNSAKGKKRPPVPVQTAFFA